MTVVGNASKFLSKCTKSGIPYYSIAVRASFSLLAYLNRGQL